VATADAMMVADVAEATIHATGLSGLFFFPVFVAATTAAAANHLFKDRRLWLPVLFLNNLKTIAYT
jgi:predicted ATPase